MVAKRRKSAATTRKKRAGRPPKGRGGHHVQVALRDQILNLTLRPGEKLDEMGLVREFGVSRTPVREALIRLASEGLVFLLPNRGARVAPLDLLETAQYFEALELTQRAINHWAALRRKDQDLAAIKQARDAFNVAVKADDPVAMINSNRDFHAAIAAAAYNAPMATATLMLLDQGIRLNWIWHNQTTAKGLYEDIAKSRIEHDQLVAALEARDALRAEKLGQIHTETFRQRLTDYLNDSLAAQPSIAPPRK